MTNNKTANVRIRFVEEVLNSITHITGALLSIAGLVLLVVFSSYSGDAWKIVSFSIFGASLIFLYTSSALYHSVSKRARVFFNKLDHSAIYVLIAGTYTPFTLVTLRGAWGWSIFGVIWGLAIAGIIFKLFFYKHKWRVVSAILYILMGWIVVIATRPLVERLPAGALYLVFGGGLVYSLGVIFYIYKKIPFGHTFWHLMVMGGSFCHYFAVFFYL